MIDKTEIKDFTLKILEKLGATLEFITPHVLISHFPHTVSEDLGEKVYLSFIPLPPELEREISEFELVVPGSDFLEKLISIARKKRRRRAESFLKHCYSPEEKPAVEFFSSSLESLQQVLHYRTVMEFNFRVTFLSDEKIESIFTVYIDDDGNVMEAGLDELEDTYFLPEPEEIINYSGGKILSSAEEIYEKSKEILSEKIESQKESIEEEQKELLTKAVARLETYYNQQKDYVKKRYKDEAAERLNELSTELDQKKNELSEKHILKIGVTLINFREVSLPYAGYQAVLLKNGNKGSVHFKRDLLKGKLLLPKCSSCKKDIDKVTICKEESHILGECCVYNCSVCNTECCSICRPFEECHICEDKLCDNCRAICPVCRKVYCYEKHRVKCAECSEDFCLNCTVKCSQCKENFCPSHVLFCKYCNKYYCVNHSEKCAECGKEACSEHGNYCPLCNEYTCKDCRETCSKCGENFCSSHIVTCNECNKSFCTDHSGKCTECGKMFCTDHSKDCPGCGFLTCHNHLATCSLCKEKYCRTCIKDNKKNLCKGCLYLEKLENTDEIPALFGKHLTSLSRVPVLKLKNWKKGITEHYFIFTASGFFSSYLFVIDKRDGSLVSYRSLGFFNTLKSMFGR